MAIAVIDDREEERELGADLLRSHGYDVVTFDGGAAALAAFAGDLSPELIVLDLQMPRVSGWDVWDWLQASPRHRHIPVVVWTASGLRNGALGAAHIVAKSDPEGLVFTVRALAPAPPRARRA